MKLRLRNITIILSIAIISTVVIMSVFDLWARLGINKFSERVIIVFAGFLGVFVVRLTIKLFLEMIIWIMKRIKKSKA